MKFFLSVAALVAVASAATPDLSSLPTCSLVCFAQAAAAAGCGVNDLVCQCTTGKAAVTTSVTPCVNKNCNPNDQLLTATAAVNICNAVTSSSTSASNTTSNSTASATPTYVAATGAAMANAAAVVGAGTGLLFALLL